MEKYGIISLNIYEKDNNWGSILQSYALQTYLEKIGIESNIIDYCPNFINKYEARYPIIKKFSLNFLKIIHSIRNDVFNFFTYIKRDNKFKNFIKNNYHIEKIKDLNDEKLYKYNGFFVGSDIIWNIDFTNGFNNLYFCNYKVFRNKNNIAYAPSLCDRKFNENEEKIFRNLLKNFSYISVREHSVLDYVQVFTNKKVINVLDPTLLLTEKDYEKFLIKNDKKKKYIFVYTVPADEALAIYAAQYAKEHNFDVIRVECLDIRRKHYDHIDFNSAGIEEWLTIIKNAEMIFTNSFHACIFSILFKKQFHAIYRNPGKTKIENLCSALKINNFSEKKECYNFDIEKTIDYEIVYKNLDKLRKSSEEFIHNCLFK